MPRPSVSEASLYFCERSEPILASVSTRKCLAPSVSEASLVKVSWAAHWGNDGGDLVVTSPEVQQLVDDGAALVLRVRALTVARREGLHPAARASCYGSARGVSLPFHSDGEVPARRSP